jgi:ABC-type thiamine transport system ATPase subunit
MIQSPQTKEDFKMSLGFKKVLFFGFIFIFALGISGNIAMAIDKTTAHAPTQEAPSHFEIIFQNENEFGNLRVSTGTSFHSPDGTLLVDAEGQAWAVEGVELADNTNVLVVLSNNNTMNNIYDDVVVGMYRVVQ